MSNFKCQLLKMVDEKLHLSIYIRYNENIHLKVKESVSWHATAVCGVAAWLNATSSRWPRDRGTTRRSDGETAGRQDAAVRDLAQRAPFSSPPQDNAALCLPPTPCPCRKTFTLLAGSTTFHSY